MYLTVAASTDSLYAGGAQNNLSSYINLTSNQTRTLEVVGNVDSTATSGVSYTVGIGNFYAKRASTLDFADNLPTSGNTSTAANQLTVNATSLTCYKDTSMGSVTRAPGATAVIGQYICTAGTSEDVRLSNVSVSFGLTTGIAANMFQNMSLWNGSTQLGTTLSTVASTSNAYSFDLTVPKNQTVTLQLKALVVSGASGVVTTSLASYNFNGKDSGTSGSGAAIGTQAGQQVTVGAGNLYITAVSDATTISRIYGPVQSAVQLGKYKFTASNDDVSLRKITFTSGYSNASGDATTLGTFGGFQLYDGTLLLATGSYVAGDVVFTGFSSTVPMDSYKVLTLKGNTNASGVISNNTTTAFAVKSDSLTDMEAFSAAGAQLGVADISATSSTNVSLAEARFSTSTAYIFHDAYPTMTAVALGTTLDIGTTAKILKFTLTNPGTRDLRFGSSTVAVTVTGLVGGTVNSAASGTVRGFRLYEDNGSGGLGTLLTDTTANSTADVIFSTTTASTQNVTFDPTNDANSLLNNFVVSPGNSRTLIVTADTSNALSTKSTGNVTLSAKISGSTGWSGTAWNTGNLFYYYTAVGGTENVVPFSHSDSYDAQGDTMSRAF